MAKTETAAFREIRTAFDSLFDHPATKKLEHTGRSVEQVYDAGGMTHLRRLAGHLPSGDDRDLNRRFRNLLHYDDPARLAVLREPRSAAPIEQLLLGYQLFHESTDLLGPVAWPDRLNADQFGENSDRVRRHDPAATAKPPGGHPAAE